MTMVISEDLGPDEMEIILTAKLGKISWIFNKSLHLWMV